MARIKKVLLCDAAFGVLPIFQSLKARGYFVGVCGNRPADPCHGLADQSFVFNYADSSKLAEVFKTHAYDYIVPGCTDISYASASHVANQLGLPGFDPLEKLELFESKAAFRENCKIHGFPTPRYTADADEAAELRFPLLVKPVDSFSGRGIIKMDSLTQMPSQAGNSGKFIYEEFVQGNLYSHSAFIKDKKIILDFFINEYCTVYPYQVNSSNVSVSLVDSMRNKIHKNLEAFAKANHLRDGLVHTQLIVNGDDFWLIEAARRCPGDLYSLLIQFSTGVAYADLYASAFCGREIIPPASPYSSAPLSRHTVSVKKDCIFLNAQLTTPFLHASYVPLRNTGEPLKAAPYDRAGIYFIRHESHAQMERVTKDLVHHVAVESLGQPS